MKTKGRKQSLNVVDARKSGKTYEQAQETPQASIAVYKNLSGISQKQRRTGEALGMKPQLAAMQNQANKAEAKKRSRLPKDNIGSLIKKYSR